MHEVRRDKLRLLLIVVVFLIAFGIVFKPVRRVSDDQFVPVYFTYRFSTGFGERTRIRQQLKSELQDSFPKYEVPADTELTFISATELKMKVHITDKDKVDDYEKSARKLLEAVFAKKYGEISLGNKDISEFPDHPLFKIGSYGVFAPKPHVKLGLDLQGGVHLILRARTQNVQFEYQLSPTAESLIEALDKAEASSPVASPASAESEPAEAADEPAATDAATPAEGAEVSDATAGETAADDATPATGEDATPDAEAEPTAADADAKTPETQPDGGEPLRIAQADADADEAADDSSDELEEVEVSREEAAKLADEDLMERVEDRLDVITAELKKEYGERIGDVYAEIVNSNVAVFHTYVQPGTGSQEVMEGQGRMIEGALKKVFPATRVQNAPVLHDIDVKKAISDVRRIIEERINGLGVAEANVSAQGTDRVVVELPGIKDPDEAIKVLGTTARMEFRKVPEQYQVDNVRVGAASEVSFTLDGQRVPDELVYYEAPEFGSSQNILVGSDLAKGSIQVTYDQEGKPAISLGLTGDATKRFDNFASENRDKWLAIYLDRQCIDARVLKESRYGGQVMLTGGFEDMGTATNLKILLDAGALPVPVDVVAQRTVSATLGADTVRQSSLAALAGLALILILLAGLYRLPGTLAVVALLIYCLITLAALVAVGAALTLPGILGLILSIGMAVDANVLIFERLKEELRESDARPLMQCIKNSYDRAFSAIIDGNATTFIIGVVLFLKGTGPIRGFAVTLLLGQVSSLFSALTVTNTFQTLVARTPFGSNRALYYR